jgi:hypothetical protein
MLADARYGTVTVSLVPSCRHLLQTPQRPNSMHPPQAASDLTDIAASSRRRLHTQAGQESATDRHTRWSARRGSALARREPLRGGRNARPVSSGPSGPTRGQGGAPAGRPTCPERHGAGVTAPASRPRTNDLDAGRFGPGGISRRVRASAERGRVQGHRLRWSVWRRRHQARARTCHYRRQATRHS